MLKKLTLFFLSIGLITLAIQATAAPRQFDIELILFKRNNPKPTGEYWNPDQQKLSISPKQWLLKPLLNCSNCDTTPLAQIPTVINGQGWPKSGPTPLQVLPASQFGLNTQWQTLLNHAAFTPLLHIVWRESVPSRRKSTYLGIMAGKRLPEDLRNTSNAPKWEVEGGIRIYLQHYLYIDTQLLYTEVKKELRPETPYPLVAKDTTSEQQPENDDVIVSTPEPVKSATQTFDEQLVSYKLDQKRRVRSGEIHYFDHPKIGILIQIRKAKTPES
ncbi:MAG: hypothetical protein CENE_03205 [Candidatus Celerinatantimonas neptuna]|nr:MAG: hypothetical protein CENE_03205 [Candidatus Celerinatantimonas neptuna]